MNINKNLILLLSSVLILSGCGNSSISSGDITSSNEDNSSTSHGSSSQGGGSNESHPSSEEEKEEVGEFKMFGDLYFNSYNNIGNSRDIYLKYDRKDATKEVTWTSSDEEVISIKPYSDSTSLGEDTLTDQYVSVASLSALKSGTSIIKAYVDNKEVASKEIIIKNNGLLMSEDIFDSILYGFKSDAMVNELSFSSSLDNQKLISSEMITTIYEETNPEQKNLVDSYGIMNRNLTDAYELTSDTSSKAYRYYKSASNKVGREYINANNEVAVEPLYNEDEETISWNYSYYFNQFNSDYFSNTDFMSFDDGKTYQYFGGYVGSMYLAISLTLWDIAPDALSLSVTNGLVTGLNFNIDPTFAIDDNMFYALSYSANISQHNTAKVYHLNPYEETQYSKNIADAIDALGFNYKAEVSIDYIDDEDADDTFTTWIFESDNVDQRVLVNDELDSHTGWHQLNDDEFGYYLYNEDTELVKYNAIHEGTLLDHGWYPSFAFSTEIFQITSSPLTYSVPDNSNILVLYCAHFPTAFYTYGTYSNTKLTLNNDGSLKSITSHVTFLGTTEYAYEADITIRYSEVGTASSNIDFTKIDDSEDVKPTNWQEESTSIYNTLVDDYDMLDSFPYLYCDVGYYSSFQRQSSSSLSGYWELIVATNKFKSEEDGRAFISTYQDYLLTLGYTDTNSPIVDDYGVNCPVYLRPDQVTEYGNKYNEYIYLTVENPSYDYDLNRVYIRVFRVAA